MNQAIPGVYNYCDRWCERCPKQSQCEVYADVNGLPCPPHPEPLSEPPDWLVEALDELNREPTPEELAEARLHDAKRQTLTGAHPASRLARRYTKTVFDFIRVQGHDPFHDPVICLAWDSVRALSALISVKTNRAIHEIIDRQLGDDWVDLTLDPRGVQSDGNGTAKLTRLIIRESREAWLTVGRFERRWSRQATDMAALLEELDRELTIAFPYAMEFVRPGFDE